MNKTKFIEALKKSNKYTITQPEIENKVNKDYIKELRSTLGVSQAVFARALGVSVKTVEKWEQSKMNIGSASKRLVYLLTENPGLFDQLYKKEKSTMESTRLTYKDSTIEVKLTYTNKHENNDKLREFGKQISKMNVIKTKGEFTYVN